MFNTLAARFQDMRYLGQLDVGGGRWAFAFDDAHRRGPDERRDLLVPAWDENAFGVAAALVLRTGARRAEHLDLMGNRSPVEVVDGLSLLAVEADPATFVFHEAGTEPATVAGRLLDVAADGVAVPGRPFAFGVKLFNPLATARRFEVRPAKLPNGFPASAEAASVTLEPGETREVSFRLTVDETFRPPYGTATPLTLEYAVADTPWRGAIRLPVNAAVAVPAMASAAALASRAPDFTLDTVDRAVSFAANDPALAHRVWRNPDDLSAKVWLGATDAAWHIAVDVTDDRHIQPHRGPDVWKSDNVQLAFQLPGQEGYWELGLTRLDDGAPEAFVFQAPNGRDTAAVAKAIRLETTRQGEVTRYRAVIPLEAVGLTRAVARSGFRFNLLVNDDDGEGRDGWIHVAPGIGAQKNPDRFPFVVFD